VDDIEQRLDFAPLNADTSLVSLLALETPHLRQAKEAFQQLNYLADYVRRVDMSPHGPERCIAVELHSVLLPAS
jgi:hypothetical protein